MLEIHEMERAYAEWVSSVSYGTKFALQELPLHLSQRFNEQNGLTILRIEIEKCQLNKFVSSGGNINEVVIILGYYLFNTIRTEYRDAMAKRLYASNTAETFLSKISTHGGVNGGFKAELVVLTPYFWGDDKNVDKPIRYSDLSF